MKILKDILILLLSALCIEALVSCRKDSAGLSEVPYTLPFNITESELPFPCEDTKFDTIALPPEPPTGFNYKYIYGNKCVNRVIYDPVDKNVIYYLSTESTGSPHWLWKLNRNTKEKSLLDKNVLNDFKISKKGWLVYAKKDKNIYILKSNGDSLKQLTVGSNYLYPIWSDDSQYIFYLDDNNGNVFKISKDGTRIDTLIGIYSPIFPHLNFIYYCKYENGLYSLVEKEMTTNQERTIVTRKPYNLLNESFLDWYTAEDNSLLFWSGDHGLSSTNLTSLETKRIISSGFATRTITRYYSQSRLNKRFIGVLIKDTAISQVTILQTSTIVEYTEDGTCRRSIDIP